jgi:hypothetical protein
MTFFGLLKEKYMDADFQDIKMCSLASGSTENILRHHQEAGDLM